MLLDRIRKEAEWVCAEARSVRVVHEAVADYAATLPAFSDSIQGGGVDQDEVAGFLATESAETAAAFHLTLDAINFGSGWFPTLRKRQGRSGYFTVALGLRDRFLEQGPWTAAELIGIEATELAAVTGQDPDHELIGLFVDSLRDLGRRIEYGYGGSFLGPVCDCARSDPAPAERGPVHISVGGDRKSRPVHVSPRGEGAGPVVSAPRLVELLAGWDCFADTSTYRGRQIPIFKRAQIATSDLARAEVARFEHLERLTLFADNLIPHVLRLDGVLEFDPDLVGRIEAGQLIEHDSPEEVEMRCGAIQVAELIVSHRPDLTAREVDVELWAKGGGPTYKAVPRPRCRCTAY